MRSSNVVRIILFAGAAAVWASWLLSADSQPQQTSVMLWAAALLLFAAATFQPFTLRKPDGLTAAVAVLIAAAMLPRLLGLDFAPYEIAYDEAIHPVLGAEVLRNEPWRIFEGVSGHFMTPYPDLVLQALLPGIKGARTVSAILSGLSLLTTYCLASHLYDRRTGAFAVVVLACAHWHIAYGRTGYPFAQVILIPTLAFWPVVRGLREDNDFLLFVGGVFLGVSGLLYTSGRIVVPVFAAWWLIGALAGRFRWRSIMPVALGLVVVLSPFVYRNGAVILLDRFIGTTSGDQTPLGAIAAHGWLSEEARRVLMTQLKTAASIYVDRGAWMAPHSEAPGPLLDTVTRTLVLFGLFLNALRFWRSANLLLLLWVAGTFVGGQVLTDVPQSAYRAAPLLAALAIAAGVALEFLATSASWIFGRQGVRLRIAMALAVLAYIAPINWGAVDLFLFKRMIDPMAAMAHLVEAGDARLSYFLVGTEPLTNDPRFALVAGDKEVHDVNSLTDLLGARLADSRAARNGAIIVLSPQLRAAESVVRRCYPGAITLSWPQWTGLQPVVGLWLKPQSVASGRDCELRSRDERGLRATYYRDDNFAGPVAHTRFEDWPMRWITEAPADYGSIEWRGFLNVTLPGTYVVTLSGNAVGSSAEIGNKVILDPGRAETISLADRVYKVRFRYQAKPGTSFVLTWQPPGGATEVIPAEVFSPYPRNRSDLRWVE